LKGFRDIQFALRLSLSEGAAAFPAVFFNQPAGEPRALYELLPLGGVKYITSVDTVKLPEPGTYFLGVDVMPPVIALSDERIFPDDSTHVAFTIHDNVSNVLLDVLRSDDAKKNIVERGLGDQSMITVVMKQAKDTLLPLTVRVRVDDHTNVASFPAGEGAYEVAQRVTAFHSPEVIIGWGRTEWPWDLISLPMNLAKPVTLGDLRRYNTAEGLTGAIWVDNPALPEGGSYRRLEPEEAIKPGTSVWLGLSYWLPSLAFPGMETAARKGETAFRVTLKKGWNQVANPGLTRLYWPFSQSVPEVLDASLVKGLRGYNGGGGFNHTDTLEPWKGYFVFNGGPVETTVELLSEPVRPPASAKLAGGAAAAVRGLTVRMRLGTWQQLRVGASATSQDGIGREDESQPPSQPGKTPILWSLRERRRLGTDMMRWSPGAVYRWKVIAGLPAEMPPGNLQGTQGAAFDAVELPPGYSAWAVSARRGIRFPVSSGGSIPLAPGFTDTLEVLAGPSAALAARLAGIPLAVGDFRASIAAAPGGGLMLRLRLPRAMDIRWSLWTPSGRAIEGGALRLLVGIYELPLRRGSARGVCLFRADWRSEEKTSDPTGRSGGFSAKLVLP
jgi:hypothetical protein